ncbi:YfiT family bacillithiol transferase [Paenibacillus phocaensis]|uniref:YfiT family bacillithiol transferase n=1 Tax=Paenibacillus phocaensis TaxID=1776378 RepID=UPI000839C73F|nr:putative metal-dependent hydrolase [Paenibacillus phocaensis]
MDSIRYPIGPFKEHLNPDIDYIKSLILEIEKMPSLLRNSVDGLDDKQLDTPYRQDGWTIRQIIHHIADNNMNAYFRFKRTLTEECPVIPSYTQDKWAELEDYNLPVEISLKLIESIYSRFLTLLRNLEPLDYKREMNSVAYGNMSLETAVQRYLWHDRHHISQIQSLISREGW